MLLDRIDDAQGSQPRFTVTERHDQGAAQVRPAGDEQDQGHQEQQEFGEGRRQEFQGRLHPLDLGQLERGARQGFGSAERQLHLLPQPQRTIEHMKLVLHERAEFGKPRAPFDHRGGDQPDHEGDHGAGRGHDQDRGHRARNAVLLEIACRRRQHGADHERHHDRQEERLGGIEHGDDADDEKGDQRERHHLGAADHRRLFVLAVGQRLACTWFGGLPHAHWEGHAIGSPPRYGECG